MMRSFFRFVAHNFGRKEWAALIGSLVLIAVSIPLVRHISAFEQYSYLGAFLAMLIGSATVFLPAPALAVVVALGATSANPWMIALVGGIGAALGEITGYLAGYSGHKVAEEQSHYKKIAKLVETRGFIAIAILAFIPNPLFDVVGFVAGGTRYPLPKFLTATVLGKIAKCFAAAYAGAWSLSWFG